MRKQVYMTAVAVMAGVLLASGCSKNQDEMPSSSVPQTETATESEASLRQRQPRHRQRNQQKPGAIICFREQ